MNTITVVVQLADRLGHHRQVSEVSTGRGVEVRRSFYALAPIEYRRAQPARIPLDIDHGRAIGSVEYLERTDASGLWAVGVTDELRLLTVSGPIYASTSVVHATDGTDIELRSVALTCDPAGVGLRPAVLVCGDFRDSGFRSTWHNRTPERPLLERAARYCKARSSSASAHTIASGPGSVVEMPYGGSFDEATGEWLRGGRPGAYRTDRAAPTRAALDERPRGPIEYGPPGRIISVR